MSACKRLAIWPGEGVGKKATQGKLGMWILPEDVIWEDGTEPSWEVPSIFAALRLSSEMPQTSTRGSSGSEFLYEAGRGELLPAGGRILEAGHREAGRGVGKGPMGADGAREGAE